MSAMVKLAKEIITSMAETMPCSCRVEQKAPRSVSWCCTLKCAGDDAVERRCQGDDVSYCSAREED